MRFFLSFVVFILTIQNSTSQNKSFTFDGTSYINIGTNVATNARTIELWFNLDQNIDSSLSSFKLPLKRNRNGLNRREFAFAFNPSHVQDPGHLRFKLNDINGIKHEVISDTNKWTSGVWHHAAAVIDSVDGLLLFIDGQLQISRDTTWTDPLPSSTDVIMIGRDGNLSQYFFEGELDEVRFSSNARYTSNFKPSCKLSDDKFTQGLYNFDALSLTNIAVDSSVNQYNGIVINASLSTTNSCPTLVGLEEPENPNKIEVYPNPSNGNVWLSNTENVKQIKVYSLSGQLILEINNPKNHIDLKGLVDGVYFLSVIGDKLFYVEKIIINKNY